MSFVLFLISGATFGSILALLSSGYSLVYGVGGVINLAHGAFYLLTVYMIFWFVEGVILAYPLAIFVILLINVLAALGIYYAIIKPFQDNRLLYLISIVFGVIIYFGIGIISTFSLLNNAINFIYPLAIIVSLAFITIIGAISYYALIKPTHEHSEIAVMIVTFALAFFIEQGVLMYEGAKVGELQAITLDPLIPGTFRFFGALIAYQELLILIVTFSLLTLLILFIKKSKLGKSIRAVAQDKDAAQLMGINVNRILMVTVAFSALLAGCAALLYSPQTVIVPYSGWEYLLLSMSVVILGGMGSLPGSVIGAYIISYARSFTFLYIDLRLGYQFTGIIHLGIILLVLIMRPRGLLGKKERL